MIFVTGGTGLVGSHLLFELAKTDEKIRALKRPTSNIALVRKVFSYYNSNADHLFERIEWVDGDILDIYSLLDALDMVEYVYHCAASVSFDSKEKETVLKTSIEGTANLVNACLEKGIKKLCHVSSIAALGRATGNESVDENTHWKTSRNNSVYAIGKYGAEREVWRGTEEGLDAVIASPSIILGPGKWEEGSSTFFTSVHKGMKFYTEGVNGFVDVRDVVKAMILLLKSDIKNERFILNAENISYKKLLFTIARELEVKPPSIKATKFLSEIAWRAEKIRSLITGSTRLITRETANTAIHKYYYSNHKIRDRLDFDFMPVEQSIVDTAALYKRELMAAKS
ncbi:MAG: NAD-dependent epimerase/dehydratase family protein [Bacteroidales bacterium]|nr:NAD-dependent epimerase/dehydratase family protein [Bacteroidales bacterium]MCF8351274.1 NAD-dependent epimerase/dehydratase family protein [Bacteroidales bacterium]MCF8377575.1 NAD-dependent epimerase/dehydratase family protein [Bacteroidales bacterium]MCF8401844.1 NAD-dependent epimerase/dehydratase family protein [Bacteroidales bacterium]